MRNRSITNAQEVRYYNGAYEDLQTVKEVLDYLLYANPSASLSNNIGTVEKGSQVDGVQLNWTLNKKMVGVAINNGIGSVAAAAGSHSLSLTDQAITANRTWQLTATDDKNKSATASTSITFLFRKYWGKSSGGSLTNAQVLALEDSNLTASRAGTVSFSQLGDEYIYICYPQSFGDATFTVNGLIVTFVRSSIVNFTNAVGGVTNYYVYRSMNKLNGAVTVTVS